MPTHLAFNAHAAYRGCVSPVACDDQSFATAFHAADKIFTANFDTRR